MGNMLLQNFWRLVRCSREPTDRNENWLHKCCITATVAWKTFTREYYGIEGEVSKTSISCSQDINWEKWSQAFSFNSFENVWGTCSPGWNQAKACRSTCLRPHSRLCTRCNSFSTEARYLITLVYDYLIVVVVYPMEWNSYFRPFISPYPKGHWVTNRSKQSTSSKTPSGRVFFRRAWQSLEGLWNKIGPYSSLLASWKCPSERIDNDLLRWTRAKPQHKPVGNEFWMPVISFRPCETLCKSLPSVTMNRHMTLIGSCAYYQPWSLPWIQVVLRNNGKAKQKIDVKCHQAISIENSN